MRGFLTGEDKNMYGAIAGDIIGSRFEFRSVHIKREEVMRKLRRTPDE